MLFTVAFAAVLHVLASLPLASALPGSSPSRNNIGKEICKIDNAILAAITAQPFKSDVLAYCSSILSIPAATATSTDVITSTVTTETPLATTTIPPAPIVFNRNYNKRPAPKPAPKPAPRKPCPKPNNLSKYASALITSACSCIATQIPITTTTTVTATTLDVTSTASTSTITIQATPTCSRSPIVNGGFDTGDFTAWTISGYGSNSLTISTSAFESTPFAAYAQCVGPNRSSQPVSHATLTQVLNTCAGVTYDVGFDYNVQGDSSIYQNNYLVVKADGNELQNIVTTNPDNRGVYKYDWSHVVTTYPIVATSDTTVLEIDFVCGYKGQQMYWLFDQVTVTARTEVAAPEPSDK